MGESAVLAHSYSFAAPITRNDSHEDHTVHALSQSVSFGKFMTENLEWGKWSSFSHKKYVEEAEKYSRPGSVAQKKAFFEAHYKRIADAKKAATQEQPTVTPAEVLLQTLELDEVVETERRSSIHQIDDDDVVVVDSDNNKPVVSDDSTDEFEEKEKENDDIEKEVLQEDWSVGEEKKKERRSITENKPVFRLSLEKTIPPKAIDTEIGLTTEKRSERPITRNEERPITRQRFSLLKCFMGDDDKTQEQDQKRNNVEKKKQKKQYLCLCLKPKNVRDS